MSINMELTDDELKFFYYDKKKNISLNDNETAETYDDEYSLALHSISLEDGSIEFVGTSMKLQECNNKKIYSYIPYIFMPLTDNEYLVLQQVKKANLIWFKLNF